MKKQDFKLLPGDDFDHTDGVPVICALPFCLSLDQKLPILMLFLYFYVTVGNNNERER
jgi:hypothetical protein